MKRLTAVLAIASLAAGCAAPLHRQVDAVNVVASPYEPAAQLDAAARGSAAEGAAIGAAGGAGIGAISAKASAGLLCTVGGPLCWIVMIPAAIVGGVVGGLAGGVADAITSHPGEDVVAARRAINQAVAEMRLTESLAARMRNGKDSAAPRYILEVEVTDLAYFAREKDLAVALRARSRLYRGTEVVEERVAEAQTDYRKYEDWAANQAQPLRRALDEALGRLGRELSPA
jgi:hypothetical protein